MFADDVYHCAELNEMLGIAGLTRIDLRDQGRPRQPRRCAGGGYMATDTVPGRASSDSIVEAWWFRFLVRTGVALLAFWTLSFAEDRYLAFVRDTSANFRFDDSLWLPWAGATVVAGFLFGSATWLPFVKVRYLPSRLLLAALALLPIAQFWWVFVQGHGRSGGWLARFFWFDGAQVQFVLAALAGVAIASGFRSKRPHPSSEQASDLQ